MSPIISTEAVADTVVITVKVSERINELIEAYENDTGAASKSAAVRELIGRGLEDPGAIPAILRTNAEAKALGLLSDALDRALIQFREAAGA